MVAFVVSCQFFEPYMAPIVLLLVFVKYYLAYVWGASKTSGGGGGDDDDEQQADEDDQQDDQPDDQDDEKFKVTLYY